MISLKSDKVVFPYRHSLLYRLIFLYFNYKTCQINANFKSISIIQLAPNSVGSIVLFNSLYAYLDITAGDLSRFGYAGGGGGG